MAPLVLAITGASGAPYAVRLLQVIARGEFDIHLSISPSGAAVLRQEMGLEISLDKPDLSLLLNARFPWQSSVGDKNASPLSLDRIHYHHHANFMAPIASGSFLTAGMILCPCSGTTLSALAHAAAGNLIQRAAEVHLKERRKLVVVPRETPLSSLQIENMQRLSSAGGIVLPAAPGWYHGVTTPMDLVDFVVGRILDQFGLGEGLIQRWGEK